MQISIKQYLRLKQAHGGMILGGVMHEWYTVCTLAGADMMTKKLILLFLVLDFAWLGALYVQRSHQRPHVMRSNAPEVELSLKRGPFIVFNFKPAGQPKALLIFGSGDGGWGGFEETVAQMLCDNGFQVVGLDSAEYATTDYDLKTLQADAGKIADHFLAPYPAGSVPLLEAGWSMGAAQAVAIAGGPHPPHGLAGVVLASALSRGRYGLRLSDKLNILPTGPGTFAVANFAPALTHLPLVQWHGVRDTIDSRAWLGQLRDIHREYDLSDAGHNYKNACPAFQQLYLGSIQWVLQQRSGELHARND